MTTPNMSAEQRKSLQVELAEIDNEIRLVGAKIEEAVGPLKQKERDLAGQRDALLERYGVTEELGNCLSCEAMLLNGDKGYRYAEGDMTCADCAPTWADLKKLAETEPESWEDDEDRQAVLAQCAQREADGTLAEKCLVDL